MIFKFFSLTFLVLGLALHATAHAIISPALGVQGTPTRGDVTRPSTQDPCGAGIDIAQGLPGNTVSAAADGSFTVSVQNFNAGEDGSREVSAKVDPTSQGTTFDTKVDILQNGDGNPTDVGSEDVKAQLPSGTKCTGGTNSDTCLVQFKTTSNFGNCVAVVQGGGGSGDTAAPADDSPNGDGGDSPDKSKKKNAKKDLGIDIRAVGTRAPRAFKRAL